MEWWVWVLLATNILMAIIVVGTTIGTFFLLRNLGALIKSQLLQALDDEEFVESVVQKVFK